MYAKEDGRKKLVRVQLLMIIGVITFWVMKSKSFAIVYTLQIWPYKPYIASNLRLNSSQEQGFGPILYNFGFGDMIEVAHSHPHLCFLFRKLH